MYMRAFIIKFLNLPATLRIKLYPRINRMIFKAHGVVFGRNLQIPGKVSWLIGGARISIGDNFYFSSGDAVNPMTSNLQGAVYVEPGAELTILKGIDFMLNNFWNNLMFSTEGTKLETIVIEKMF